MKKRIILLAICLVLIIGLFPLSAAASSYKGASAWAVPELDKAESYELITERVKNNVSANITREEFAEIAVRLYEKYTGKKASSGSAAFNDTANAEILKAANMGLVGGVGGGSFAPGQLVTREQMATILLRTLKVINPAADFSIAGAAKFADDVGISGWAREGVYYCANNGIIKGIGNNMFGPGSNSTREAAVIICVRAYELYKFGQVIPTVATPAPASAIDFGSRISAGDDYAMAILDDNSLWGWGFDNGVHLGLRYSDEDFVYKPAPIMKDAKAVYAGWGTTLVIKTDNSLWAWGDNMPGVGEDRITYALKPEKIMDNVISAASGHWFVLAVKSDGSLWGWGNNTETRLNENLKLKDVKNQFFYTPVVKPTKMMDGVKKVTADGQSYCVLKNDGTLLYYGANVSSGNKVTVNGINHYVLATGVKDMATPTNCVYYIKNDDSLFGVGRKVYEDLDMSKYDYNKENAYDHTPVKVMDSVKSVFNSTYSPTALKKDGALIVWGSTGTVDAYFTKNPIDTNTWMQRKTLTLMDGVRALSGGPFLLLAGKNDGSIWTWGLGVLGDGDPNGNSTKSTNFFKLDFNKDAQQLFTSGTQKSGLLFDWIKEKEASGGISSYNPDYKANWNCDHWEENIVTGFHTVQTGSTVYGYDAWNAFVMSGKAEGNKLSGHMFGGIFEIRLNPDGKSYSGFIFDNSAAEANLWTGSR